MITRLLSKFKTQSQKKVVVNDIPRREIILGEQSFAQLLVTKITKNPYRMFDVDITKEIIPLIIHDGLAKDVIYEMPMYFVKHFKHRNKVKPQITFYGSEIEILAIIEPGGTIIVDGVLGVICGMRDEDIYWHEMNSSVIESVNFQYLGIEWNKKG